MLKGFRDFIMRGNVVDLAVAFVIGAAFATVIDSFVKFFITPLIAAVFGKPSLNDVLVFQINGAIFSIGAILTQVINFICVSAAIYFIVVVPMNKLKARNAKDDVVEIAEEIALLREIRDSLKRGTPTT